MTPGTATPGPVAMVGAVVVDGDRVLLGLRRRDRPRHPGVWDVPGGRVEAGESPGGALRRELREELGIDTVVPALPWRHLVDHDRRIELSIWVVRRWTGTIVNHAPDEHDRLAWFTRTELGSLPVPHPGYPALLTEALGG